MRRCAGRCRPSRGPPPEGGGGGRSSRRVTRHRPSAVAGPAFARVWRPKNRYPFQAVPLTSFAIAERLRQTSSRRRGSPRRGPGPRCSLPWNVRVRTPTGLGRRGSRWRGRGAAAFAGTTARPSPSPSPSPWGRASSAFCAGRFAAFFRAALLRALRRHCQSPCGGGAPRRSRRIRALVGGHLKRIRPPPRPENGCPWAARGLEGAHQIHPLSRGPWTSTNSRQHRHPAALPAGRSSRAQVGHRGQSSPQASARTYVLRGRLLLSSLRCDADRVARRQRSGGGEDRTGREAG